jgi:hypothetical protein
MDNSSTRNNSPYQKSDEELSWDTEFANMDDPKGRSYSGMLGDLAGLVVRVPRALLQLPLALLPDETARHARAAAHEGFLAFRSLVAAVGDGIESLLVEPRGARPTVSGPAGTWGTGRSGTASSASSPGGANPPGKARRIELNDEVSERGGGDGQPTINIDDLSDQEGRGLRADIDY